MAIGGTLHDWSPRNDVVVKGHSYVGKISNYATSSTSYTSYSHKFHFELGVTTGLNAKNNPVDWGQLEYLARTLQAHTYGIEQVHVACKGGLYSFNDFPNGYDSPGNRGPYGHDSVGGSNILVVFNTHDTVYLTGGDQRRPWVGSILAPFSDVVVDGSIGSIDGIVVAKSYRETGMSPDQIQIHANCPLSTASAIQAILTCGYERNCRGSYPPTDSTYNPSTAVGGTESHTRVTCADRNDRMSSKRCLKKQAKGKCIKAKVSKKCDLTCGCKAGFRLPDASTFAPAPPAPSPYHPAWHP